jgi:hypothetical protein
VRFYEVERRYAHSNPQSINAKINGSLVLIHFAHISRAAFRRSAYARIVIHDGVEWRDYIGRRVAVSNAKAVKAGMLCGITRKYSEVNSVRPKWSIQSIPGVVATTQYRRFRQPVLGPRGTTWPDRKILLGWADIEPGNGLPEEVLEDTETPEY